MHIMSVLLLVVITSSLCWLHGRYGQQVNIRSSWSALLRRDRTAGDIDSVRLNQRILDTLNAAIVVRDASGAIVFFNNAWRKFTGRDDGELYGEKTPLVSRFLLADGVTQAAEEDMPMYHAQRGLATRHRYLNFRGNKKVPVLVSGYPLQDVTRNQCAAMTVVQDFSAVRDIELELERERVLLHTIIKALPDAFVFRDMSGKATLVNDTMRRLRPQPKGKNFIDGVVHGDFLDASTGNAIADGQTPMDRALRGETVFREELIQLVEGGESVDLLATSIPVYDNEEEQYGAFTIMQDISALKKVAKLRDRTRRAQALHNLAAGIAHDFNNQLSTVLGNAQLALTELQGQETIRDSLQAIIDVVHTSTELTKRLMALGNTSGGKSQQLSIQTMLSEFMSAVQSVFKSYTELDVTDIDPDLFIFCDRAQFESALLNLLLNAKEATALTDRPHVFVKVKKLSEDETKKRGLAAGAPYVSIVVEDNGEGFTAQSREEAFDPFFTTRQSSGGTGLGLTMVEGFVHQYHGQVNILNRVSSTTQVEMVLPLVPAATRQTEELNTGNELLTGSGATVLIVEDQPEVLRITREMLSRLNYHTVSARSAEEGLLRLDEDSSIVLAIVDVLLGDGMNGVQMMNNAQKRRPDVKVIYTSGYAGNRRDITLPMGQPFLQKPVDLKVMSRTIHQILA